MNKKTIETLKDALEALDTSQGFVEASANAKFCDGWGSQLDAAEKAITELRTVIATIEAQQPVAYRAWFDQDHGARWLFTLWPDEERLEVDWEPLYAAPVQPVDQFRLTGQDYADIYEQSADWDDFAAAIDSLHRRNRVEVPLYSTPVMEAQQGQKPVAWFAFGESNGPIPLELYGWDEKACKHAVLTYARAGNWKGTVEGYLMQQGWTLRPVYAAPAQPVEQHDDDAAVDSFAKRMKSKLEQARQRGRSGWQDCAWTPEMITQALRDFNAGLYEMLNALPVLTPSANVLEQNTSTSHTGYAQAAINSVAGDGPSTSSEKIGCVQHDCAECKAREDAQSTSPAFLDQFKADPTDKWPQWFKDLAVEKSASFPKSNSKADVAAPSTNPLTDQEVSDIYFGATGQSLRPADMFLVRLFAHAVEARAKFIKGGA